MITLIAACDEQGGIGFEDRLPWPRIPEDMKHFRDSTLGLKVIMGRKTFESLGKKTLPNRTNIVASRGPRIRDDYPSDVQVHRYPTWCFDMNRAENRPETFVIGGAQLYDLAFPYASRILLTRVVGTYPADTFWKPDVEGWPLVSSRPLERDGVLICTFEEYKRPTPEQLPYRNF
jgi:dihydrofolate reductase